MVMITVSHDVDKLAGWLSDLQRKQIPFAASVAINRTAELVKSAEELEIRDVFDRPTPLTRSAVFVKRSNKQSLEAVVGLKDYAAKGTAASKYLATEITGGVRRLKRFERALRAVGVLPEGMFALPGTGIELDAYGNISPGLITQILSYFKAFPEAGYKANITAARRAKLKKGTKSKRGFEYFVGRPGDGRLPLGIWRRINTGFGSAVKPVMIFVERAGYEALLDFVYVASQTVEREFPRQFRAALDEALRSAR